MSDAGDAVTGNEPPPSGSEDQIARTQLANERTYLAWIRTALALTAAGVAVARFLPPSGMGGGRRSLGLALILFGAIVVGSGYLRWRTNVQRIKDGRPMVEGNGPSLLAAGAAGTIAIALVVALTSE